MRPNRILLCLALTTGPILAEDEPAAVLPEIRIRHSTFTISSENDKYFAGTDHHYTNGFKLT